MKNQRQRKILELIKAYNIETQEDLVAKLKNEGFDFTQATVSRDIKELGLIKVAADDSYKYFQVSESGQGDNHTRLMRYFLDSVINIDYSENLIVIKTLPGVANAIASCIDNIHWPEIIGTVAGDDTILLIIKPKEAITKVLNALNKLLV